MWDWLVQNVVICGWVEGDRTFNLVYGTLAAGSCLAVAVPILWWSLPSRRLFFFTPEVDPHQTLQVLYGNACMAMAVTNFLCRFIRHVPLPWAHSAFFYVTVLLVVGLGPRAIYVALNKHRFATRPPLRLATAR